MVAKGSSERRSACLRPALGPAYDHVDVPAPAAAAHEPACPSTHRQRRPVALGLLGRIGLDLVLAVATPHDQPHPGRRGVAQSHLGATVAAHWSPSALEPCARYPE